MTQKEKMQSPEVQAKVREIIAFCEKNNLTAEQVGCWIWVTFESKPDEATRRLLKGAGFRWSRRRKKWAHNVGVETKSSKGNPWDKYEHRFVSRRIAS